MRRNAALRIEARKLRRRKSVATRSSLPLPLPPRYFEVLRRVDAYADYIAVVRAGDAKEAAQLAYDDERAFSWEPQGVVEFDARLYVTLDRDGSEIEGTEIGDR